MGIEILKVEGGRVPLIDKEVETRSKVNGPVKPGVLTPEERAQLEERIRQKAGPQVKPWQPTLTRDEYLQKRIQGKSRDDIKLSWFNNEMDKLSKQLREWKLLSPETEREEVTAKQLEGFTREIYLTRRAAGETRTQIMKSLNVYTTPYYALLEEWGLRDKAVEIKVLAELNIEKSGEQPVPGIRAETQDDAGMQYENEERKAAEEAFAEKVRNELEGLLKQKDVEIVHLLGIVSELTEDRDKVMTEADHLRERVRVLEQRERELCALQKAHDSLYREYERLNEVRRGGADIADQALVRIEELEAENLRLKEIDERGSDIAIGIQQENKRLKSELTIANDVVEGLRSRVRELEYERERNKGFVFIRVPILPGDHPIQRRIDTASMVDRFATEIESASMDRGRAAMELFQLVQTFVGLVYSELADLHPGCKDVAGYVKSFFGYHNQRHMADVDERAG